MDETTLVEMQGIHCIFQRVALLPKKRNNFNDVLWKVVPVAYLFVELKKSATQLNFLESWW